LYTITLQSGYTSIKGKGKDLVSRKLLRRARSHHWWHQKLSPEKTGARLRIGKLANSSLRRLPYQLLMLSASMPKTKKYPAWKPKSLNSQTFRLQYSPQTDQCFGHKMHTL
jgi:hypothetical protein